ncbi:hypothetical protein D9M70_503120 [compost metagenome]
MGGARHDTDRFFPEVLRTRHGAGRLGVDGQAGRKPHEGAREAEALAQFRADGDTGGNRFALPLLQRRQQFRIGHCLDLAFGFDVELAADLAHEIDVKTGELAGLIDEVERRKVDRRQEAQARKAREIGLGDAFARIEQNGQVPGLGRKRRCDQGRAESEQGKKSHGQRAGTVLVSGAALGTAG